MTLDESIDAFSQAQRPQCDWYIQGNDYSRLAGLGFRNVDCWYKHLDAAVFILATSGETCYLRKGQVTFNGARPYPNYPPFHCWLEIPAAYAIIDFVIGYHLLIGGHGVRLTDFHPLRLNTKSYDGLVYVSGTQQYRLDASNASSPMWM